MKTVQQRAMRNCMHKARAPPIVCPGQSICPVPAALQLRSTDLHAQTTGSAYSCRGKSVCSKPDAACAQSTDLHARTYGSAHHVLMAEHAPCLPLYNIRQVCTHGATTPPIICPRQSACSGHALQLYNPCVHACWYAP